MTSHLTITGLMVMVMCKFVVVICVCVCVVHSGKLILNSHDCAFGPLQWWSSSQARRSCSYHGVLLHSREFGRWWNQLWQCQCICQAHGKWSHNVPKHTTAKAASNIMRVCHDLCRWELLLFSRTWIQKHTFMTMDLPSTVVALSLKVSSVLLSIGWELELVVKILGTRSIH